MHAGCYFAANTCTCMNGVAETGADCPVNGTAKCFACNTGWTINNARTECNRKCANLCMHEQTQERIKITWLKWRTCVLHIFVAVNTCSCKNGVAQTGTGCPASGAKKCASCNTGWTINYGATKCICTCKSGEQCAAIAN